MTGPVTGPVPLSSLLLILVDVAQYRLMCLNVLFELIDTITTVTPHLDGLILKLKAKPSKRHYRVFKIASDKSYSIRI